VKTTIARTHIKTDYKLQAAKIADDAAKLGKKDPRVCELRAGDVLPISTVMQTARIGLHIQVKLFEAKCSFKAGTAVYLYAEHFSNVPQSQLDFMNKKR